MPDLGGGEAFDFAQYPACALPVGQLCQGGLQGGEQFRLGQLRQGARMVIGGQHQQQLVIDGLGAGFPAVVDGFVRGEAEQPGAQGRLPAVGVQSFQLTPPKTPAPGAV